MEGFRPELQGNNLSYKIEDGIFKRMCARALKAAAGEENLDNNTEWKNVCDVKNKTTIKPEYLEIPSEKWATAPRFVLIIDEINRGNISKIFGELITLIESNKRLGTPEAITVSLPYSGEEFGVPQNVYIIGTMNSTDKSIALVDIALRRRFNFERIPVDYNNCIKNEKAKTFLKKMNERICAIKDEDHEIGHSYFMKIPAEDKTGALKAVFDNQILPLLEEYFYNDWEALAAILGPDAIEKTVTDKYEIKDDGTLGTSGEKQYGHKIKRDIAFEACCTNLGLER